MTAARQVPPAKPVPAAKRVPAAKPVPPARRVPPAKRLPPPPHGTFKLLRVAILLLVLLVVALTAWQDRYLSTRWRVPLYVSIYPIAADDSAVTRTYLAALDGESFKPIDAFFAREAARYGVSAALPIRTRLRAELHDRPPQRAARTGLLGTALWSLRLRYWAWRAAGHVREPEDIRLFVLYHDPALTPTLPHSLGLTKGLIGVVYAFATPEMNGENDVVIAHELLHTVGATDKYESADDAPRFPEGYGNPAQIPLYPQLAAELMAGRRMLSPGKWQQAASLDEVVIGPATAQEIRWPQHAR
ncbi:MAG TPA: hypothetical protein VN692_15990 [Steroidobacteraceae bacterium]|nr:hypothetical protein [Steroidobacteraceae bacterium]